MGPLQGLPALACLVFLCCVSAHTAEVTGHIGCHRLSFAATEVRGSELYWVDESADLLAVAEVYPDSPDPVTYAYDILCDGARVSVRRHESTGFGPITWFCSLPRGHHGGILVRKRPGSPDVLIAAVRGLSLLETDKLLSGTRFTLMGLVPPTGNREHESELAALLAKNLPTRARYGIDRGFAYEVRFANAPAEHVRAQLEACAAMSRQHSLPVMLGLVTWWSGTPLGMDDGLGGKFGDLQYQQICYAPDHEHPEDPALRAMLGDRYNPHYGRSVPNQWSSTPWLTMNSPTLNAFRYRRLRDALGMLDEAGLRWSDVRAIFLENEPRYWDTACEASNDKSGRLGKTLWADFNPLVTRDAQEDGVNLDPSDGLSAAELSWLHRNVGAYNQEMVDVTRKAFAELGADNVRLYTHSLQHRDMFPGADIGHPASEWAYARGARTGLEGMWSQPSDYERVREWGPWANINREENDGRHIDEHLWDLRVTYMMGGDVYNSYNWNAIGAQRFFDYVNEFLRELPVVELSPVEIRQSSPAELEFRAPMKLQAFSRVEIPVRCTAEATAWLTVTSPRYGRVTSAPASVGAFSGASTRTISFEFPTPAQVSWQETATASLEFVGTGGRLLGPAEASLTPQSATVARLSLDIRTQRALSLWAIANGAAVCR